MVVLRGGYAQLGLSGVVHGAVQKCDITSLCVIVILN